MASGDPLDEVREALLDQEGLARAVASGRQRGREAPPWRRVELRYVDLKRGRHLQVTSYDETQAFTANHDPGAAPAAVQGLLDLGFGTWHVETDRTTLQVRVTKKGKVLVHSSSRQAPVVVDRGHDREKPRMVPLDAPFLRSTGITDADGRLTTGRRAKYHQVEELVRALAATWDDAAPRLRAPTPEQPLRVVDLGCGNGLLTFAAHHHLRGRGLPVRTVGVDRKAQSRRHNETVAAGLGWQDELEFVEGDIGSVELPEQPDIVLALHACDTATDDALARAVQWGAPIVLAAPCCHHDVSAQLRAREASSALLRDGILRERFADTLTDALRASLLRARGYRVDVVEFVGSEHTPRNTLIRAVRVGGSGDSGRVDLEQLLDRWPVRPRLQELLEPPR